MELKQVICFFMTGFCGNKKNHRNDYRRITREDESEKIK